MDPDKKRIYQREWLRKRREKYMAQLGPCFFCESSENLQLHHLNPDEKVSHKIWSWRKERLEAELEKCVSICKRCHDKLHALERMKPLVHGTLHAYDQRKCRCDECRAVATGSM